MNFEMLYLQIAFIGAVILAAHFGGKITRKLHVGEVVGQILAGLILGPILLFFIRNSYPQYQPALQSFMFLIFIFLSVIAFGVGEELSRDNLKKMGTDATIICFIQAIITWIFISVAFLVVGFRPLMAMIIGSIGIATASGTTFIIMNKLGITGRIRSVLGGIVVLDDVLEVIVFSILCQIMLTMHKHAEIKWSFSALAVPILLQFLFATLIGLGIFIGIYVIIGRRWIKEAMGQGQDSSVHGPELISRLISEMPGPSVQIYLIIVGLASLGVGLAMHWHLPFLMTAVIAGALVANLYTIEIFQSLKIENATSIFTLVFFALVGANARLDAFEWKNLLYILVYTGARGSGKLFGNWFGCWIMGQDKRISQSLPKLMLPQTGVAVVEAYFVATVLGADGMLILQIILPSIIIFDIVGILLSEQTLLKWRSWLTGGGELIEEEEMIREMIQKEKFNIVKALCLECFKVPFKIKSKGEAIWELIRSLHYAGHIHNPGEVLEIILKREHQGGTTLGDGISILHGRLPYIKKPVVTMGLIPSDHKVNFGTAEDAPVDIVYMVLSPQDKPEIHLQVLATLAMILSNQEARESLRHAKDEFEAFNVIKKFSNIS